MCICQCFKNIDMHGFTRNCVKYVIVRIVNWRWLCSLNIRNKNYIQDLRLLSTLLNWVLDLIKRSLWSVFPHAWLPDCYRINWLAGFVCSLPYKLSSHAFVFAAWNSQVYFFLLMNMSVCDFGLWGVSPWSLMSRPRIIFTTMGISIDCVIWIWKTWKEMILAYLNHIILVLAWETGKIEKSKPIWLVILLGTELCTPCM